MIKHIELRNLDRAADRFFRLQYTPAYTAEIQAAHEAAQEACRKYRQEHDLIGRRGY